LTLRAARSHRCCPSPLSRQHLRRRRRRSSGSKTSRHAGAAARPLGHLYSSLPTPKALANSSRGQRPGFAGAWHRQTLKEFASVTSRRNLHCIQFGTFSENVDIHPGMSRADGAAPVVRHIDRHDRDVIDSPKMPITILPVKSLTQRRDLFYPRGRSPFDLFYDSRN
jgi:hypothetical protein